MPYYLGLDVHQKTSTYCLLDANGKEVRTVDVRGRWDVLLDHLKRMRRRLDDDLVVGFEASLGYGWLYDRLTVFCRRVVVAHPGALRMIFKAKRKNDRVDAKKIATLLLLDQLPAVHVPDSSHRQWRELIEFRKLTVAKRTRCKNSLRALLRAQAITPPRSLWSKAGQAWLRMVELPTIAALKRELLLDELGSLDQKVHRITQALDALGRDHPSVVQLQTIPGVGPRTAEAFVAYIDDPHRFARSKQIGAYLGLVPSQDASAGVNRLGHMTKEGPSTVRHMLTEATWRAIKHCPHLAARFEAITAGRKDRRKLALVAISHKLARIMLTMLKTGEVYHPPTHDPAPPTQDQALAA